MNVSPVSVKFTAAVLKLLFKLSPKKLQTLRYFYMRTKYVRFALHSVEACVLGPKFLKKTLYVLRQEWFKILIAFSYKKD
ncbi:Uncharacterised protein [Chlamydia abortus]|nr:Uncharacterised protein [Chlamydia abortus]